MVTNTLTAEAQIQVIEFLPRLFTFEKVKMDPQSFPICVQFLRFSSIFLRTFSVDSPCHVRLAKSFHTQTITSNARGKSGESGDVPIDPGCRILSYNLVFIYRDFSILIHDIRCKTPGLQSAGWSPDAQSGASALWAAFGAVMACATQVGPPTDQPEDACRCAQGRCRQDGWQASEKRRFERCQKRYKSTTS
eukprot:COSAG02_NODE_1394_length_12906_cov_3.129304_11_plen_192_part_00